MKIIGITGGVGAGKTQILEYLNNKYGATICMADEVGKKLQKKGTECFDEIVAHFGEEILDEKGELDRTKLSDIVFSDRVELSVLNGIVHPKVKEEIQKKIAREERKSTNLMLIEGALLIEDHYEEICDELWYVYVEDSIRRKRLKYARGYEDCKVDQIFEAQLPKDLFMRHCDRVIDNSGQFEASGSSGNCIYVGDDQTHLLVDTGISKKRIEEGLAKLEIKGDELEGILITHEHVDHIQGLGVFSRKYEIPIYATPGTIAGIRNYKKLGNLPDGLLHEVEVDQPFSLGTLNIDPFAISHDANEPSGYRIDNGKKAVAVATDLGIYDDYTVEHLKDLNAVVLEANHDIHMLEVGPYPYPLKRRVMGDKGHLSNELSGKLLCDILHDDLQYVVLGHLSKENNYEELAYETVRLEISIGDNPYKGNDIPMMVAKRDQVSDIITL